MKRFYLDGTVPTDRRMVETPPGAEIPGAFVYHEDHERIVKALVAALPDCTCRYLGDGDTLQCRRCEALEVARG